mmetsp:Transcript_94010/g.148634  ORF Transcript_94010/g.148634 Transcript_94010/m.148634 type:complete len:609 (+) Transcript_94010:88-1914(+)
MPGRTTGTWTSGPTKAPSLDTWGLPLTQRIREEFCRQYATSQSISIEELALHWQRLAEDEYRRLGRGRLSPEDNQAIALRVCQALKEMDLKSTGRVDKDEWVHHVLLSQSANPTAVVQINSVLKAVLLQYPGILGDLQHMFELADTSHTGLLTAGEILDVYRRDVWRLRIGGDGTIVCDAATSGVAAEKLASDTMKAMDLDGDGQITYTDFMSYCLGRRKQEVVVHLYDLSNGLSQSVLPWILGEELEGIWHCGVVVFGKEYYFGGELVYDTPGQTAFGIPKKQISLGHTLWRRDELHAFIVNEMKPLFNRDRYDTIYCNCNHFADRVCTWLTGNSLPKEVARQGEELMRYAATRAVVPVLNRWLKAIDGKAVEGERPLPDDEFFKNTVSLQKVEGNIRRGEVVTIHPESCGGHAVLGTISGPYSPTQTEAQDRSDSATDQACWVTYFGIPTLSARGGRGRLCTELLPCERISKVNLNDVAVAGVYQNALNAMTGSSRPISGVDCAGNSDKEESRCRGSASGGLAPIYAVMPGSMSDDLQLESPRLSEGHGTDDDEDENLRKKERLVQMGFEAGIVEAALVAAHWKLDAALALLRDSKFMSPREIVEV